MVERIDCPVCGHFAHRKNACMGGMGDYCDCPCDMEQERLKNIPPVDRTKRCMTSGNPEAPDHRELLPNGQQKDYVVLCPTERAKGFVRPVRRSYIHKTCHSLTTMGTALAETYARDPQFYSGTFCCNCAAHFPLDQFVWEGTDEILGS
jgi:hypothetical protein